VRVLRATSSNANQNRRRANTREAEMLIVAAYLGIGAIYFALAVIHLKGW
jgi:hypothetical protein